MKVLTKRSKIDLVLRRVADAVLSHLKVLPKLSELAIVGTQVWVPSHIIEQKNDSSTR